MKALLKTGLLFFFLIAWWSCAPNVYQPTASHVECGKKQYADLTLEQLQHGMRLYSDKCGSCHTLFKPQAITAEKWAKVLPDMKTEAKLSESEYQEIVRYVTVMNQSPNPANTK